MCERHSFANPNSPSGEFLADAMKQAATDLGLTHRIPRSSVRHIRELLDKDGAHEALRKGAEALGLVSKRAGSTLQELWAEAAGPEVAEHTKAVVLRRNVLTIKVDSSVWVQELGMFRKVEILQRLHEMGQAQNIRDMKIDLA